MGTYIRRFTCGCVYTGFAKDPQMQGEHEFCIQHPAKFAHFPHNAKHEAFEINQMDHRVVHPHESKVETLPCGCTHTHLRVTYDGEPANYPPIVDTCAFHVAQHQLGRITIT
jgi:hypothetical protein